MSRSSIRLALAALALSLALPASVLGNDREYADLFGQGMAGPVVAANGAEIVRGASSVKAKVQMAIPDEYAVGPGATSSTFGSPAAFSLWVFVFFNPDACLNAVCGPGDLRSGAVVGAGFNAAGHIVGGSHLTLSGSVGRNSQPFGPAPIAGCVCYYESIGEALDAGYSIADAEIHLAVAPHGQLDPSLMPAQITTPAGGPPQWWIALFLD